MKSRGFLGGVILLTWAALLAVLPDIRNKVSFQKQDVDVAMAVDWEDIVAFDADINALPAAMVVLPSNGEPATEAVVRKSGKKVLWRLDDSVRPDPWILRFQEGDGVFVAGEHALEHPRLIRDLPKTLQSKNGFLVLMEFVPAKFVPQVASRASDRLIKGHVLPTRQMLASQKALWKARLVRAVEDRWIRLLVVRFSPALSLPENLEFQKSVSEELVRRGYLVGAPQAFRKWPVRFPSGARLKLALFLSIITPLAVVAWAFCSKRSPIIVFLIGSMVTVMAGLAIHGLGATPWSALGLGMMRGVKIQLALPLLLVVLMLLSRDEIRRLLDVQLRIRHFVFIGAGLALLLAVYLMRSGNFPLLPVSDGERHFRDWLDQVLVARPRFKEFMIGHPLFLTGLLLKRDTRFQTLAKICLGAGIIGQISILNTFTHFHTPLALSLLRTLNGICVGSLIAMPSFILLHWRKS